MDRKQCSARGLHCSTRNNFHGVCSLLTATQCSTTHVTESLPGLYFKVSAIRRAQLHVAVGSIYEGGICKE